MPKPYEKNAKKHSSEQLFKIARSIKEFGWRQPIVCDKDDVIIVGHGRYWAYEKYKNDMKLPEPRGSEFRDKMKVKRRMAKTLLNNGFSYRQIASFIGWKSTNSVNKALK